MRVECTNDVVKFTFSQLYDVAKAPRSTLQGLIWKKNLLENQTEVGLLKFINTELAVQTLTRKLWANS